MWWNWTLSYSGETISTLALWFPYKVIGLHKWFLHEMVGAFVKFMGDKQVDVLNNKGRYKQPSYKKSIRGNGSSL